MSGKIEIEWFLTTEKMHPDKPGKASYEHVPCLVQRKHYDPEILLWNCEHLVWDDSSGDDYECSAEDVIAWAVLPGALPPRGACA